MITLIGWAGAVVMLAAAVLCAGLGFLAVMRGHGDPSSGRRIPVRPFSAAAADACGSVILLAVAGAFSPLRAGTGSALLLAIATAVQLRDGRKGAVTRAIISARYGLASLAGMVTGMFEGMRRGPDGDEGPVAEVVAAAVEARAIPPLRADPAVGDAPGREEITSAVAVPAAWAALAAAIASFESDDEAAEIADLKGHSAGFAAVSQAFEARADRLLNGVGLDPAAVAGVMEIAEAVAHTSGLVALVIRRLLVVYQEIRDWLATGKKLPHKARQWFGDGQAA